MGYFLDDIARAYIDGHADALVDYCFIFPNKRSGVFFTHYLRQEAARRGIALLHPAVTTISEFLADVTDGIEASRIEQLFILYRAYREVMTEHGNPDSSIDFNKFQYWGDVLINDFNDVDKYLVDPQELFHNIATLKEISANYLTPEQIEVIRRYWNTDKIPPEVQDFWNHTVHPGDSDNRRSSTGFVKLWQVMYQIYTKFRAELKRRNLRYPGMIYREAVDRLKLIGKEALPHRHYVFIGFNVLSTSEEAIFDLMMDAGIADFYWDYASPVFADDNNRATRFLKKYVARYRSPGSYDIGREQIKEYPRIEITGMPTQTGQAKYAGEIVGRLFPDNGEEPDNDSLMSTAIVLPDESMCMPVIHALPERFRNVNITMGYPMRHTSVASLVRNIISMQLRVRKLRYENTFYYEDVITVLSHPLIRTVDAAACDSIVRLINDTRLFNIPVDVLGRDNYPSLHPLFEVVTGPDNPDDVFGYLGRLVSWLQNAVDMRYRLTGDAAGSRDDDDENDDDGVMSAVGAVEHGFLSHYQTALSTLRRLRMTHLDDLDVHLEDKTVFHLVERLVAGESVNFEGMPLKGLQVMGMLETRALDFENVIITSMNERIFPRKHHSKSFIPNALRRGFGMSTLDHQESISAYYFYRLISRAKRVFLLYDARTSGVKSGEMSRYLHQLRYLYRPENLKFNIGYYNLKLPPDGDIALPVSERAAQLFGSYRHPGSGRFFSASSINKLIECPLQFYLCNIEGYYPEDELKEYMDEATYGTIMHEVVERLYMNAKGDSDELHVDRSMINRLNKPDVIMPEITRAVNKHYRRAGDNVTTPLTGDAKVMGEIMLSFIRRMLEHELDDGEFYFIHGELKQQGQLEIAPGLTVNFKQTIDRIDRMIDADGNSYLRIVDYKTGGERLSAKRMDAMFDRTSADRPKALLQLFLYCNAYARFAGLPPGTRIRPVVYKFRDIAMRRRIEPIKIGGAQLDNYLDFNEEFMELLASELGTLFSAIDSGEAVFNRAATDHACKYCKFTQLCHR